jgi:hypothetical protein
VENNSELIFFEMKFLEFLYAKAEPIGSGFDTCPGRLMILSRIGEKHLNAIAKVFKRV